jgi:hypothetical protein
VRTGRWQFLRFLPVLMAHWQVLRCSCVCMMPAGLVIVRVWHQINRVYGTRSAAFFCCRSAAAAAPVMRGRNVKPTALQLLRARSACCYTIQSNRERCSSSYLCCSVWLATGPVQTLL